MAELNLNTTISKRDVDYESYDVLYRDEVVGYISITEAGYSIQLLGPTTRSGFDFARGAELAKSDVLFTASVYIMDVLVKNAGEQWNAGIDAARVSDSPDHDVPGGEIGGRGPSAGAEADAGQPL